MEQRTKIAAAPTTYPDLSACAKLWQEYQTPPHIIEHCKAVSQTASILAEALNKVGRNLNIELVKSAGWLHDIVRLEEVHAEKGAAIARAHGYPEVAEIVDRHMSHQISSSAASVDECDLVCLADRMVKENQFVGLAERMVYIIEKSRQYEGAEARIKRSFAAMGAFKKELEEIMGVTVEELMK